MMISKKGRRPMDCPDSWVIIKITGTETLYKVLAGWSGSYLYGTSWRLNSGIVKVEGGEDYFQFIGYSGSVYKCRKDSYGICMSTAVAWHMLQEKYPGQIELMDKNTDWSKLIRNEE